MDGLRLDRWGVDLWLNTPKPLYEASGTSGTKAAHNGVPSLSVFDGWWLEERIEGATGWGIGPRERGGERSDAEDAADLYRALEETILPIYHGQPKSLVRDHARPSEARTERLSNVCRQSILDK